MRTWLLLLIFLCSFKLIADDMRPASVTVTAINATDFNVVWKIPIRNGIKEEMQISLSDDVRSLQPMRKRFINNAYVEYHQYSRPAGIMGLDINVEGIERSSGDVLLRVIDQQQQSATYVLNIERPSWQIESFNGLTAWQTAIAYIELGIEHILIGLDHLLFVACLVYISGTKRKLILTITGFTIAHSITLFISATGIFSIPIQPVEAVIALSIVFLAWEIAKNKQDSISIRYPVLVSSSFGLLHGFGFAAVLGEIGLPVNEKLLALLSFNIGVELGQLIFVLALYVIFHLIRMVYAQLTLAHLRTPISYTCGIVASFWMIERLAAF